MTPEEHSKAGAEERAVIDMLAVIALTPIELIAKTASFLYKSSQACKTGDPDMDLTPEESLAFLHMAEHLMVYIGLFPEDWDFVAAPDETGEKARQVREAGKN